MTAAIFTEQTQLCLRPLSSSLDHTLFQNHAHMRILLTNWEIFYLLNLGLTYICNILMAKVFKNTYIHDRLNYVTLSKSIHN